MKTSFGIAFAVRRNGRARALLSECFHSSLDTQIPLPASDSIQRSTEFIQTQEHSNCMFNIKIQNSILATCTLLV